MATEQSFIQPEPESQESLVVPAAQLSPSHTEKFLRNIGFLGNDELLAQLPQNEAKLAELTERYPIKNTEKGLQLEVDQAALEKVKAEQGLSKKMDQIFAPDQNAEREREALELVFHLGQEIGNIIPDNPVYLIDRIISKADDEGSLPEAEIPKLQQKIDQLEEMLPRIENFITLIPVILEISVRLQDSPLLQTGEDQTRLAVTIAHLQTAQQRFPVDLERIPVALDKARKFIPN